jgi:hypothetical protein
MLDKLISISVDFEPVSLLNRSKTSENEILFFYMGIFLSYLITANLSSKLAEVSILV